MKSLLVVSFQDVTYTLPMGMMWTVLEPELALICANFALMRTLLSKIFPSWFGTKHSDAPNRQRFRHLEEGRGQYPLNRIRIPFRKTENGISGPEPASRSWPASRIHTHSRESTLNLAGRIDRPTAVPIQTN